MENEKSLTSQNEESREKPELQKLKDDILNAVLEISSENTSISEKLKNMVEEIFQKKEASLASDDCDEEESDNDFVNKYFHLHNNDEDENEPNKLETLVQEVEKTIGSISSHNYTQNNSMYPHSEKQDDTIEKLTSPTKTKTKKKSTSKKTTSTKKSTKTKKAVPQEVKTEPAPEDVIKSVEEVKPVVEEPVIEKPVIEEVKPVVEEPAVEDAKPTVEEPAVAEVEPVAEKNKEIPKPTYKKDYSTPATRRFLTNNNSNTEKSRSSFSKPSPHIATFLKPKKEAPKAEAPKEEAPEEEAPEIIKPITDASPVSVQQTVDYVKDTKKDIPDNLVSAHKETDSEINKTQKPVDLTNVVIDENCTDPIGGVFGLEDEKPLTGSFTLSEQLEDNIEKSVDDLDVPLGGSFGVKPSNVTVSGKFIENTKPVVTMVENMATPAATPSVAPIDSNDGQIVENLVSAHKETDSEINKTQKPVDLTNVVIDENCTDPIGGVFGLEDEKPLTGSFTLSEQLEDNIEKSVDDLDVPLGGSFGVKPSDVTVSGKFIENTKPVVTMVENMAAPAATPSVAPIDSNDGQIVENLVSAHKETDSEINKTQKPVDLTNVVIDENCTDPIGGVFGLEDEKPLTGSFTLSEQLEDNIEKSVDDLDVPLGGSFGFEPSDVTVSGKFVENTKPVVTKADDSPLISFEENDKFHMDDITTAILNVAKNNASKSISSAEFAEQVKKILEKK